MLIFTSHLDAFLVSKSPIKCVDESINHFVVSSIEQNNSITINKYNM